MAKKNSRDLFKQMNSNVSVLEETDGSPILDTENGSDVEAEHITAADKKQLTGNKSKDAGVKKAEKQVVREAARKPGVSGEDHALGGTDPLEKRDSDLVRITYNLTYDLNEKFSRFTERFELYKTSLIKALMEGWLDGSIELDENEVLFNDGLIKIKKKAGSRKAVGSILISAELDKAFTKKCHETGIEKNNCIFRLLKKYLEQKAPD